MSVFVAEQRLYLAKENELSIVQTQMYSQDVSLIQNIPRTFRDEGH